MDLFSKQIESNPSGWIAGDKVTIADLHFYTWALTVRSGFLQGIPTDLLDKYPAIVAHEEKVKNIPEVQAWYGKHTPPYSTFDFTP